MFAHEPIENENKRLVEIGSCAILSFLFSISDDFTYVIFTVIRSCAWQFLSLSYNHSKVTNCVHPVKCGTAYESQDLKLSLRPQHSKLKKKKKTHVKAYYSETTDNTAWKEDPRSIQKEKWLWCKNQSQNGTKCL